jgi:hypothetical protein
MLLSLPWRIGVVERNLSDWYDGLGMREAWVRRRDGKWRVRSMVKWFTGLGELWELE